MRAKPSVKSRWGRRSGRDLGSAERSQEETLTLPQQLERYDIQSEIRRGSFVRVFRAFDKDIGRLVTLKIATCGTDSSFAKRFLSEAAAVSKLRDTCVAAVYDFGEEAGVPFAVMQCPDGERLDRAMSERREFTLLHKTTIMWHVARGINALHSAGIVTRIRPDGVVLGASGSATISDFGVLRLPLVDDIYYQSPEEIAETTSDYLSDIFSFGAIYYELLTGSPLGESGGAIAGRLAGCTDSLANLVRQAVETRRELRYQNFEELQCDAAATVSELRRIHTAAMLPEIRAAMDACHLSRAQEALAHLLQIDSGNLEANRLLVELRARLHQQTLTSRIASLCHESEIARANGDLKGAMQLLQSALQVDPENAELGTRLSSLEGQIDRAHRYADAVREAHRLFNGERPTEARGKLLEAIEIDSSGKEAPELLAKVCAAIARAEADRVIERATQEARELTGAQDFDQALATLEKVRSEFPDCSSIQGQIDAIQILRGEANAALTQAIEEADLLIENDRPDLALELLRDRSVDLQHRPEIRSRISELNLCLPAWTAHRAVQDALARASALERLNELAAALTVLEETLAAYPDSAELREAADALCSRRIEHEHRRKLERRMQAIRQSIEVQNWPHALALLEAAIAEFPAETRLRSELAEMREAMRTSECKRLCAEARQLLAEGEIEEAERLLQGALENNGDVPDIAALREELASRRIDEEDWRSAKALFGRRQFDEAERILERLADRNRAEVAALLELIRTTRALSAEEQFYGDGRNRAVKLMEEGEYKQAAELLRHLLSRFPGDPILVRRLAAAEVGIGRNGAMNVAAESPGPLQPQQDEPESQAPPSVEAVESTASARPTGMRMRAIALTALAAGAIAMVVFGRPHQIATGTSLRPGSSVASSSLIPAGTNRLVIASEPTPKVPAALAVTVPAHASPAPTPGNVKSQVQPNVALRSFVPPPASQASAASAVELSPVEPVVALPMPVQSMAPPFPTTIAPPPPPPAQKKVGLPAKLTPTGGKLEPAKLLSAPAPKLPDLARQLALSGEVRLEITISTDGSVKDVRAISGHAVLVQAAKQAVQKWQYQPAQLNGMLIESHSTVSFHFEARQ